MDNVCGVAKKNFKRGLQVSAGLCECLLGCPFGLMRSYIRLLPDPQGSERERERVGDPGIQALALFRAVKTLGLYEFTKSPLGVNTLRGCIQKVNARLPKEFQISKCTGHSGRMTMVTTSVNEGVDPTIVALASKHRDPSTLKGYIKPNTSTMMSAARAICKEQIVGNENEISRENLPLQQAESSEEDYFEDRCATQDSETPPPPPEHGSRHQPGKKRSRGNVFNIYIGK